MRDVGQGMAFSWWQLGIGVDLAIDEDDDRRRTAKRRKLKLASNDGQGQGAGEMHAGEAARAAFAMYCAAESADNDADSAAGGADAAALTRDGKTAREAPPQ